MRVMTYDEMRQLNGGDYACAIAGVGLAAAEIGLIAGFATGGIGFGIAVIGVAASLYGVMAGCSG